MQWAVRQVGGDEIRVEAQPGIRDAVCPGCRSPLIPKCGKIVIHHWAHESGADCDAWTEPESEWHRQWKDLLAPPEQQEVVLGCHRADIVNDHGVVIELQHSSISPETIRDRDHFYNKMGEGLVWLFDARDMVLRFKKVFDEYFQGLSPTGPSASEGWIQWKHPRQSWWHAVSPAFWDIGHQVLEVVAYHQFTTPCYVRVRVHSKEEFIEAVKKMQGGSRGLWDRLCDTHLDYWNMQKKFQRSDFLLRNEIEKEYQSRYYTLVNERDHLKYQSELLEAEAELGRSLKILAKRLGIKPEYILKKLGDKLKMPPEAQLKPPSSEPLRSSPRGATACTDPRSFGVELRHRVKELREAARGSGSPSGG